MLFTAVEARRVQYDKLTRDDTVAAVAHDFPASFEHILRVLPRTKTIAIVNGASPNETFWLGELQRETAHLTGRVKLKFYDEMSFEDILKDAANLPPHSAIFWHLMNVDAAGVAHEANAALSRLSATANAPVFSYLDNFFGDTTVGGPMHSAEEGSAVAAAVAVRILNGEKAGDIKTPPDPIRITEIRLATNAALRDQRERPAAGEHGSLQAALAVGDLPLADPDRLHSAFASRWSHHAPDARAASPSVRRRWSLGNEWWSSRTSIVSPPRAKWLPGSRTK